MALMRLNFPSSYLSGNTEVNVILPDLPRGREPGAFYGSGKKYPVLWLLHGSFGDASDWVRKSNIELYACEKNLIVVMPSALNSDYTNWPNFGTGYQMYDFLTEELMPLVYNWLPASDRREDNFIAGLSMGGSGVCVYAMNHPEKFSAACVLSSAPKDMREPDVSPGRADRVRNQLEAAGGQAAYLDSYRNTWDLAARLAGREDLPRFLFLCGTEDPLAMQHVRRFRAHAESVGFPAVFEEVPGYTHEWRFWDLGIQQALAFFLPDAGGEGNAF